MNRLVLVRHGESIWNRDNRFTGWTDVDLSDKGLSEAKRAGQLLEEQGFVFDIAFTSVLKRAIRTLWIVLEMIDQMWLPVHRTWRLNERFYGALQGLDKADTVAQCGKEQVQRWRRGGSARPPSLESTDERYPGNDPRYKELGVDEIPRTESLKDAHDRFLPCWQRVIEPRIRSGERVLIVAHHNILMGLIQRLETLSDEEVEQLDIPTAVPIVYELDQDLAPIRHYRLGESQSR